MNKPKLGPLERKVLWEILEKEVDVLYKILILIIGGIVAGGFLVLQNKQNESHYYADLMAQREKSDSDLRSAMFKVLFDAYFGNKIRIEDKNPNPSHPSRSSGDPVQAASKVIADSDKDAVLDGLRQERMLADLLARNFDSIDIRPLLEDLEARLARYIDDPNEHKASDKRRHQAFEEREQLRRVAVGAIGRQVAALEGLGSGQVRVSHHGINTCRSSDEHQGDAKVESLNDRVSPPLPPDVATGVGAIEFIRLRDGAIDLRISKLPNKDAGPEKADLGAGELNLTITFFDMPTLENIRLKDGERVSFSMSKYLSKTRCSRFKADLDESLRIDCAYLESRKENCEIANFRVVILPKNYLGVRDRPYVNDLASGRYSTAWWRFW